MLPLLSELSRRRPQHKYVEDRSGDGALIGIARNEDDEILGVEIMVGMRVYEEGETEDDHDSMKFVLATLHLTPEDARNMAFLLTATSVAVDIEAEGDS